MVEVEKLSERLQIFGDQYVDGFREHQIVDVERFEDIVHGVLHVDISGFVLIEIFETVFLFHEQKPEISYFFFQLIVDHHRFY